jgi:hypothetical protein
VSDRDRRVVVLLVFVSIAAGAAALAELLYLLLRWAGV